MPQKVVRTVKSDDVMGGEPRIEGRRITVRQVADLVEGQDLSAKTVADRYDLDIADVYRALSYYHEHPEEMTEVIEDKRRREEEALKKGAKTLEDLA